MSDGILILAFGEEYVKVAEACLKYSVKNIGDIPVCVLTNVCNHSFNRLDLPYGSIVSFVKAATKDNRGVKTSMINYTPFDRTLYMDCDCVIQNKLNPDIFNLLSDYYIIGNKFLEWESGDKVLKIYRKAMKMFYCTLPIRIYNGGCLLFDKSRECGQFFVRWNRYWNEFGCGREMPPLACAIQKRFSLNAVGSFREGFFEPDVMNPNAVIQHYCNGFNEKFNVPAWNSYKPFDTDPTDFTWVDFEDKRKVSTGGMDNVD